MWKILPFWQPHPSNHCHASSVHTRIVHAPDSHNPSAAYAHILQTLSGKMSHSSHRPAQGCTLYLFLIMVIDKRECICDLPHCSASCRLKSRLCLYFIQTKHLIHQHMQITCDHLTIIRTLLFSSRMMALTISAISGHSLPCSKCADLRTSSIASFFVQSGHHTVPL